MAVGNTDFDTFLSSTQRKRRPGLVSSLIDQQALWWQLSRRGLLREESGGHAVTVPLLYGDNSTVSSFSGYDTLDNTPQAGMTTAVFDWKYIAASTSISGQEVSENQGSAERIFNLLEAKMKQTEVSLKKDLNVQTLSDGTGNGGKDITGLAIAVEDGTGWATYGNIDRSDALNTFWRNQWFNFDTIYGGSSTFGQASGSSTKGIAAIRKMYGLCDRDGERPSLILTTSDLLEAYESNIEGDKQRIVDTKMADAGFSNLTYKGVPIVRDEDVTAENMIFLNSNHLKISALKGQNFHSTPFQTPVNQHAKVSHTIWGGNLTCDRPNVQGRITLFSI